MPLSFTLCTFLSLQNLEIFLATTSLTGFLVLVNSSLISTSIFCLVNMPKDKRSRSTSFERRARASPFGCSSSTHHRNSSTPSSSRRSPSESTVVAVNIKEWEEARCPVCMEHPHNAVLLHCSCYEKGCRAYMCDTSHRHSNCLDQFRKACSTTTDENGEVLHKQMKLSCPLCRGSVHGWTVAPGARRYMDAKVRSCSTESCGYSGTYMELRKHARIEHPSVRPTEADPERQRDWRRMERQWDIADVLSSIQSALGVEDRDVTLGESEDDVMPSAQFTVYLVVHVLGGIGLSGIPSRVRTRRRRRYMAPRAARDGDPVGSRSRMPSHSYIVDDNGSGRPSHDRIDENDGVGSRGRRPSRGYIDESDGTEHDRTSSQGGQERESRRRRMRTPDDDDDGDL